ncbi:MAG: aspartate carbamoyltransferase [Elusimicrobia bacterium RIFCSPHIGHO2_02_FULL_57_9]|nr:MAG: aspartate carbamoyltransferase [Elusimicrobia bacterium RIFCSPHIGHO2_02_FULL_57_9]
MTAKTWDRKDLLGLQELSASEIETILDAAVIFKSSSKISSALSGSTAAFLFSEPSTRTRSSFEVAARRLGAEVLGFSVASSSLLKGESLLDTLRNLEAMGVDYFILRHEHSGVLESLAPNTRASLINAGDGAHEHPTQALLDLFTLREKKKTLKGLKVVIVGDILHSRVARSNIHGLKKLGARVTVCGPSALIPGDIEKLGVAASHDLDAALKGADAVNVLRLQLERQNQNLITSLSDYFESYGLTPARLAAAPGCVVLHPGPINRGVEISSQAADGPNSLILEQVKNGVAVRMAVLSLIGQWRKRNA